MIALTVVCVLALLAVAYFANRKVEKAILEMRQETAAREAALNKQAKDGGTVNGDDQRVAFVSRPITAGTASAATVFTSNITATVTGGCSFVRLRETDPPAGTTVRMLGCLGVGT